MLNWTHGFSAVIINNMTLNLPRLCWLEHKCPVDSNDSFNQNWININERKIAEID